MTGDLKFVVVSYCWEIVEDSMEKVFILFSELGMGVRTTYF